MSTAVVGEFGTVMERFQATVEVCLLSGRYSLARGYLLRCRSFNSPISGTFRDDIN